MSSLRPFGRSAACLRMRSDGRLWGRTGWSMTGRCGIIYRLRGRNRVMATDDARIKKLQDRCRHYTGTVHERCAAGVEYTTVRDDTQRPYRWPCFRSEGATTTCPHASFLSDDEARDKLA